MAQASMPPVQEARSIFGQLGYTVSGDGPDMLAERKWRTVQVTALSSREATNCRPAFTDGGTETQYRLRCFVTWDDHISALRERLRGIDLPYEWAIIGVSDNGGDDYEVVRGTNT
ncbi:hypothetical protein E6P09_13310 [Haloferax mediterranei ATCC 33500]|uniref:Uncharacterized protein n=2 Tax=Haloferax mediterranei (strain ATCC 33500 / DSM 1411 / JCM 8866 / NBRC 14739 / NCIMB 2177 / R-4) TaxID=523841 RepID=I3R812_HALMT|nr:hypothetical protein [Haloferax mediterranei]AFK20372.1 hypothetical protein HFX_2694 [Haloferax mediterranei ATCC 33500]AHZ23737.1 hypothetical protein BM92_14280 [Haloferax mediterranei ATCC 33500]MDX5986873.1 hypothetical protein [Haloferax mediterranei ATCC 33500]QCQ76197.1 hypothetical protein E6P09_13310 [Haloferax mediterranei ATCC 33500]